MSYVEEFCEDIVIINHGEIVLSGYLKEIKREYGKDRLFLAAEDQVPEMLAGKITEQFADLLQVAAVKKDGVIVKLLDGITKKAVLGRLASADMELEFFGNYEPSLTDIFVERAGDQA